MQPVIHFEMPYEDANRLVKFYSQAFGWPMKALGEQMGGYVLATTARSTPDGRPLEVGAINGGFFPKKPDWPMQHPSVVIGVDDIRVAMAMVVEAGGKVLGDPIDIPGIGAYVSFVDTEGNRASLLEPLPMAKPAKRKAAKKAVAKRASKKASKKPATRKAAAKKAAKRKPAKRKPAKK